MSLSQKVMAFWTKKKLIDKITEYLYEAKTTYNINDGGVSFEIFLGKEKYSLTPYILISNDDKCISFKINLRKLNENENNSSKFIFTLNKFNNNSNFFIAKVNQDGILYLEYNSFASADTINSVLDLLIEEIFMLQKEINEL